MRRKILLLGALTVMICSIISFVSVGYSAPEAKSLLKTPKSTSVFVYDGNTGKYTMNAKSGEIFEVNSYLTDVKGYTDSKGGYHQINELVLDYYYKVYMDSCPSDHTVLSLIISETDDNMTYIQPRANGALYILTDDKKGVLPQQVREFNGKTLSLNETYTLFVHYENGKITLKFNDNTIFENQEIVGKPCFKLCAFGGKYSFSDVSLTTTSDFVEFDEKYPESDANNPNLLDVAGFPNSITGSSVEVKGNSFVQVKNESANYVISNEYLNTPNYLRLDTNEYSDGTDMDYHISADITLGKYPIDAQGWYGYGIIFGECPIGYVQLRIMKVGQIFVHGADKSSGDTRYDINYTATANGDEGSVTHVDIYYIKGLVYLKSNGQEIINGLKINGFMPKFGIHSFFNMGRVDNFSFKFIQPINTRVPSGKSEETAVYSFSRGKKDATQAKKAISGSVENFKVDCTGIDDYFLMQSLGYDNLDVYKMTGSESYKIIEQNKQGTIIKYTLKDITSIDGNIQLVFRHNATGTKRNYISIASDGTVKIFDDKNEKETLTDKVDISKELEFLIITESDSVSMYINGKLYAKSIEVETYGNAIGFGGNNSSYTVDGLSYKYLDNIKFTEPQKETFPEKKPIGEANTEYIKPTLPQRIEIKEADKGCGNRALTELCVLLSLVAGVILLKNRRK